MTVHQIAIPGIAAYTYLVVDPETNKGAVIDPTRHIDSLLALLKEKESVTVQAILETHAHADFISGAKELKERLPGHPPIYCSGLGGKTWAARYADVIVDKDRYEIDLGSLILQAWFTPGHTPEHLMWVLLDKYNQERPYLGAFTGDFLLANSIGRPDILGGEMLDGLIEKLYHSVFTVLKSLPDNVTVYPGHGKGSLCAKGISGGSTSTLAFERQNNRYLAAQSQEKWRKELLQDMPAAPAYFSIVKKINLAGPELLNAVSTPKEFQNLAEIVNSHCILVDVRQYEHFAAGHLIKSFNIPLGNLFNYWAPQILPYDKPLALIAENKASIDAAITGLRLLGLDKIEGYLILTPELLAENSENLISIAILQPTQVESSSAAIIDVRTGQEWSSGHIEEAKHCELQNLENFLSQLLPSQTYGLVCGGGPRSSIGASLMQRNGFSHVFIIKGGMTAWKAAGLKTTNE